MTSGRFVILGLLLCRLNTLADGKKSGSAVCALGGLELLQDQLTDQKKAEEHKVDPQLNHKSVLVVQSSNVGDPQGCSGRC